MNSPPLITGAATTEKPQIPRRIKPAVPYRPTHENQQAIDKISIHIGAVAEPVKHLFSQRRCDAFIGVENEYPVAGERQIVDSPVFLIGIVDESVLDHRGAGLFR